MKDTIVIPGHYMLMFRQDCVGELENATDPDYDIKQFVKKYAEITHYYGKIEIGTKTQKKHYQMVMWTATETTQKQRNKLRKYWTDKFGKATCAITVARKKTLPSYCNKEKGKLITNLTQEQQEQIPKWIKKEESKKTFDQMCDSLAKGRNKAQYAAAILELCRATNRRPNRNLINYFLWKHEFITNEDLLHDWKVIDGYYIEPEDHSDI